jgi:hypothetical protein
MKRKTAAKPIGGDKPKANTRAKPGANTRAKPGAGPKKEGGQPGNANATRHGFYGDLFTEPELALVAAFMDPSLNDEISMQRVLNRRLMAHANLKDESGAGPTTDLLIKLVEALAIGTGRVASLLRDRRMLSSSATKQLTDAVATVLEEMGKASGQKL